MILQPELHHALVDNCSLRVALLVLTTWRWVLFHVIDYVNIFELDLNVHAI